MFIQTKLVTEIPEAPKEITLHQAAGLIPKLAGKTTEQSFIDRLRIHDPVLRVFALTELTGPGMRFTHQVLQMAMHVAQRSSFVRQLLMPRLLRTFRFDLAERLIKAEQSASDATRQLPEQLMIAAMRNDYEAQAVFHEHLYLQTGDLRHITEAATIARERLTWDKAWRFQLRLILVRNETSLENSLLNALQMFERENARNEFAVLGQLVCQLEGNKLARAYAIAQRHFWQKEYAKCLEFMHRSNALDATQDKSPLLTTLAAQCAEAQGDFTQAAQWYEKHNRANADQQFLAADFIRDIDQRAALNITRSTVDRNTNCFIMTGFPRSGTTLLENSLHAHPHIATCEETSSLVGSLATAYASPMDKDPERKNPNLRAFVHRQLYYQNLMRFVTKADAKVVIDKTPIISANIKYMEKIFPAKHYLFSLRHPYDVIISNWKQTYSQNPAMAAFNDIYDSCLLYNKVMSDWFEVFPGETERVYYVRYDELVNDFRRVVEGALTFLGVEWTDEVLKFVEHATKRAVRTPSYGNVRKGLTIGVQSSWKNFEFLFDERCRALLDPWVARFGY